LVFNVIKKEEAAQKNDDQYRLLINLRWHIKMCSVPQSYLDKEMWIAQEKKLVT